MSVSFDLEKVKRDLQQTLAKCQVRGLVHSTAWLAELLLSVQQKTLKSSNADESEITPGYLIAAQYNGLSFDKFSKYSLAKCYFDNREYARCAHLLASVPKQESHPLIDFLLFYSRYMSIEKRVTEASITDRDSPAYAKYDAPIPSDVHRENLSSLKSDMVQRYCDFEDFQGGKLTAFLTSGVDLYTAYVYALVQIRLGCRSVAMKTLVHIVKKDPLMWPAWFELSKLFGDREKLDRTFPPSTSPESTSWMLEFFRAKVILYTAYS